jgi:hypothetical protein
LQITDADAFFHPFDHKLLWSGHSSLIDEIVSAGVTPDAVVRSRCNHTNKNTLRFCVRAVRLPHLLLRLLWREWPVPAS